MANLEWLQVLGGFVAAFLIGSFAEYVVHRLMHKRVLLGQVHVDHHKEGFGQGFVKELKDYLFPAAPFIVGAFLADWLVLHLFWLALRFAPRRGGPLTSPPPIPQVPPLSP